MKLLIMCLTIFGSLMGSGAFAVEKADCSNVMLDIMSATKPEAKTAILCMKGDEFFRECSALYLELGNPNVGLEFLNYLKEAELAKFNNSCK